MWLIFWRKAMKRLENAGSMIEYLESQSETCRELPFFTQLFYYKLRVRKKFKYVLHITIYSASLFYEEKFIYYAMKVIIWKQLEGYIYIPSQFILYIFD